MCSSRILVAPSAGNFQTAIFKFEVLLSIFCGTKITLEWTTPQIFRSTPHYALPTHRYWNFFDPLPHIIQYFEDSIPPICKWREGGGQTMLNMFTEFSIFVAFFQKEFNPLRISFFKIWVEYFVMLGCFKCYLVHKIFLHWIFVWSLLKENKTTLKTSTSLVEEFETNQI